VWVCVRGSISLQCLSLSQFFAEVVFEHASLTLECTNNTDGHRRSWISPDIRTSGRWRLGAGKNSQKSVLPFLYRVHWVASWFWRISTRRLLYAARPFLTIAGKPSAGADSFLFLHSLFRFLSAIQKHKKKKKRKKVMTRYCSRAMFSSSRVLSRKVKIHGNELNWEAGMARRCIKVISNPNI